jgi:hypothetical protein
MFPDPSGATTPVAPLASKPQDNEDLQDVTSPSRSGTESAAGRPLEPHWDSVIGAATD